MQVKELVTREVITLRRDEPLDAVMRVLDESPQDIFPVLDAERLRTSS